MTDSKLCKHCQKPVSDNSDFCCQGCEKAYNLIHDLKLDNYYTKRILDPETDEMMPDYHIHKNDLIPFIIHEGDELKLHLFVERIHCAACVGLIEQALLKQPEVTYARVNMSTRRLVLKWRGDEENAVKLIYLIEQMGYGLKPFDPEMIKSQDKTEDREILKCLAIAGFAMGNIMLLSVSVWSSSTETMGIETRNLMHWLSALIAMPTIIYAGQPFFKSAITALKSKHSNMDVPISLALIMTTLVSLHEVINKAEHIYFDSAVMLLFFLLIGRYLDKRARSRARDAAEEITNMFALTVTIKDGENTRIIKGRDIKENMLLEVATGERIASDGIVVKGESEIDTSLITGETFPKKISIGENVYAGTLNLNNPLRVKVTKIQEDSLLSEIIKLMEKAEQKQSQYIRFADKVIKLYTPTVHLAALATFLWWLFIGNVIWQEALLTATTVLIITCPCALALAVPIVQVIVSGRLFKKGIFIKSGDAIERLSQINSIAIDKTGTLTFGKPQLKNPGALSAQQYQIAASMAKQSRHPASIAIQNRYNGALLDLDVTEVSGSGLETNYNGKTARLGNKLWCDISKDKETPAHLIELWFTYGDDKPVCLQLEDKIRPDAKEMINSFKSAGVETILLSGDRKEVVEHVAEEVGIEEFYSELKPTDKITELKALAAQGKKTLMIGDGLNDAPALMEAHASISPSTAIDITQNAANIIFQGDKLMPIFEIWQISKQSQKLVKENIALSLIYNVFAIPLAITGHVTPLIAAVAMSASSLIVTVNSFRIKK